MSVQIVIDPNVRVEGNRTFAGFEDVRGGMAHLNDAVDVVVEETDLVGSARVTLIDWEARLIYLEVDWSSIRPASIEPSLQRPLTAESPFSSHHVWGETLGWVEDTRGWSAGEDTPETGGPR